jgi:PTS system nitrogen regulatory IIA component
MNTPDILTVKEIAEYLRVSEATALQWVENGEIPTGKFGDSWRIRRADLDAWIQSKLQRQTGTLPPPGAIRDVLRPECVLLLNVTRKADAFDALIDCLVATKHVSDRVELAQALTRREELMSTGIGLGVGVPHVRLPGVTSMVMAAAVSQNDITDYASLDGMPVRLIFMIVAGAGQHADYLRILSSIGRRIKVPHLRDRLLDAPDSQAFFDVLVEEG